MENGSALYDEWPIQSHDCDDAGDSSGRPDQTEFMNVMLASLRALITFYYKSCYLFSSSHY